MGDEVCVKGWIKLAKAKAYLESWVNADGEVLSSLQVMRCLALGNAIASEEKIFDRKAVLPKGQKYLGTNHLSEFYDDYQKLLSILKGNKFILLVSECTAHRARVFQVGEEFLGGSSMHMTTWEHHQFNVVWEKRRRAGELCSTSKPVMIDIDRETVERILPPHLLMKEPEHTPESLSVEIARQWGTIQEINATRSVLPLRKRKSRGHSLLTGLSKPLDGYIRIDGIPAASLDQHATYFTLLPRIIDHCDPKYKNNGFVYEMEKLESFIRDTGKIYDEIARDAKVPSGVVKNAMNRFICDPIKYHTDWNVLDYWMIFEYWNVRDAMRSLRPNNRFSTLAMRIESGIFMGASRQLNELGVPVLTKHDSLIFDPKDRGIVEDVLRKSFEKARVCYKCKYSSSSLDSERIEKGEERKEEREDKEEGEENTRLASTVQIIPSLSVQRSKRSKVSILGDGRFRLSIKGKSVSSRSGESMGDFQLRILREYPGVILRG